MKRKVFFSLLLSLALMIWIALAASAEGKTFADSADGSKDNPYVISNEDDWNAFCDLLLESEKGFFTDKTVKLGADIGTAEAPVTRMAGDEEHCFTGTFDGDCHTLTVKYGSADSPIADNYAAPFAFVENCTIENLRVSGDIYSSAKYAGGLVGSQYGAVAIRNCRVSAVIHSYTEGDGTHGGIVGVNYNTTGASLAITGCLFDGKLLTEGTTASTSCSGFVGFRGGDLSIADSLYAPTATGEGEREISDGSATFVRNAAGGSVTNCYYTRPLGDKQGTAARSVTGAEGVTVAVSPVGEPTGEYDVSGITVYAKGIACADTLYYGNGDDVSLTLDPGEIPEGFTFGGYKVDAGAISASGNPYTLTMPDQDVTVSAIMLNPADISVSGDVYTIHTAEGWDLFCDLLAYNDKGFFDGKTVRLDADIGTAEAPVTRMAGGSRHDFTGTFDGNDKTLIVRYGSADSPNGSNYTAPFNHVENGCKIENLHVSGDIYTAGRYVGGLVGLQFGTVAIHNCHVSAVIHSYTTSGDPCHGGFVGYNGSSLTIEGCLFDGKLLTEGAVDSKSCAGFVGWQATGENLSFTDCLYAPAPLNAGEKEPNPSCRTFVRNSNATRSFTNCYYTRPLGGAQGTAARSITEAEGITVAVSGEPTGEYNVSGITAYAKGIVWNNKIYCGDVYTIHTAEGWNLFCDLLAYNDKDFFTGKTVKLDNDITVTRMAGGDQHDFCGTFDGQTHTLTFNCGSADSPVSEAYIAPFRYVSNVGTAAATIQNLRVAGDIYTSAKYAAGFIGRLWGTVNIENCRSSVVIHSSVDGDGTHGGFVPENLSAPLNITGCVFDGKLLTTGSTTSCGGFVGYGGTVNISNSLYAPAAIGAGDHESARKKRNISGQ